MAEPVADVVKGAFRGQFVAHRHVAVREDEEVDGCCDEHLTGILHLEFLFALELQHAFIVRVATRF